MGPLPLASTSDLAAWVGQDIPDADPRAGAVLSAASAMARGYAGQAWDDTVPDDVAFVVVQAAARVWLNPSGLVAETIDDYSRRFVDSAADGLYFTDAEKAILGRYRTGASGLWVQPYGGGALETQLDELFVSDFDHGDASGTYLPGQA